MGSLDKTEKKKKTLGNEKVRGICLSDRNRESMVCCVLIFPAEVGESRHAWR